MNRLVMIAAALLAFAPLASHAQTQTARTYQDPSGQTREAQGTFCVPDAAGGGCGSGGGSGGATTIANGADVAEGSTADATYTGTGSATVISLLKGNYAGLIAPTPTGTNRIGTVGLTTASGVAPDIATPADNNPNGPMLFVAARNTFYDPVATQWRFGRGDQYGGWMVPQSSPTSGSGAASVASTAVTGGQVIKAAAGNLYGLNIVTGGTAGFVLVTNTTTVPADGAVTPAKCYTVAPNTSTDISFRGMPVYFSAGISVSFSTTGCFTKTASATAFISGDAK